MKTPYRILCVCMSNVCRSPSAEAVIRHLLRVNRLDDRVEVDSAATHGYGVGSTADERAQRAAWARGYDLSQMRARKIGWQDFDYFDLILAMDKNNLNNLRRMATEEQQGRIRLFMDFTRSFDEDEVPDPYVTLGGRFEYVLDMIEDAARGLVDHIKSELADNDAPRTAPASGNREVSKI